MMSKYLTICTFLLMLWLSSSEAKGSLVTLDEDNWTDLLTGEWMVEFFAPWCPACKALEPEWKTFSSWSDDLGIRIGAIDVTANPGLSGRFIVTALPTIYHVKDGVFRQYKGSRDSNTFVTFVEEKKWTSIEPVSSWKSPNSYQMSIVSYFFKISMALRSVHNRLVEDYGIPYWGSYILFAFATILLGAVLGLVIVCVIDLIFPAKVTDALNDNRPTLNQSSVGSDSSDLIEDIQEDSSDETNTNENTELRRRRRKSQSSSDERENDDNLKN